MYFWMSTEMHDSILKYLLCTQFVSGNTDRTILHQPKASRNLKTKQKWIESINSMPISYALAEMEISNAILLNEIKSYFFLWFYLFDSWKSLEWNRYSLVRIVLCMPREYALCDDWFRLGWNRNVMVRKNFHPNFPYFERSLNPNQFR